GAATPPPPSARNRPRPRAAAAATVLRDTIRNNVPNGCAHDPKRTMPTVPRSGRTERARLTGPSFYGTREALRLLYTECGEPPSATRAGHHYHTQHSYIW